MKSPNVAKQLECHGFVCQSPEDAIVIAATLYQNLMAHMGSSQVSDQRWFNDRNHSNLAPPIRTNDPESQKIEMESDA